LDHLGRVENMLLMRKYFLLNYQKPSVKAIPVFDFRKAGEAVTMERAGKCDL
jgi:hypothetical protein